MLYKHAIYTHGVASVILVCSYTEQTVCTDSLGLFNFKFKGLHL